MEVKDKLKIRNTSKLKLNVIIKRSAWLLVAFVLSFSSVAGGNCPFAIALITVSSKKNFLFSSIGAGIGYILFCGGNVGIRYFSAVIIAGLGTLAINIFNTKKEAYLPMLLSLLSVLTTGIVMNIKTGAVWGEYVLVLGEAVLAMGSSFFFFRAVHCNIKRLKFKALPIADTTCLLISCAVLVSSLSVLEIKGFSPARMIAALIMLVAVRFGSQLWGLIIALCLGFAIGISGENSLFLLGAYAFSALVASLFTSFSSLGVGIGFALSMTFFAAASGNGSIALCSVLESLAAVLILVLLPEAVRSKITEFFESGADIAPDGSLRQSLVVRLRFASSALSQVSESVRDVRTRIQELGRVEPLESEIRMVAADQFFSISDMLEDLAFEFDEAELFDYKAAGKIRRMLGEYDIYPDNISVIVDKFDRLRIEILASAKTRGLDSPRIKNEIEKICKREFEKSKANYTGANVMLSIIEKPNFKMDFGFAQYCAEGKLCGDTVKMINDGRGHMIFIISDGMGKGGRAALDGAMGAGLLSKLLSAGFGFDSSLKVVNSALLVKSSEESLATLDCACVDLFTGKCEFFKAGAPKSYILKNNTLTKCELSSMPAGILRGIEFAKRTTVLNVGDEIIMMSDGITDVDEAGLDHFIKLNDVDSPNGKAQAILDFAIKNGDRRHLDDMSVIVARLIK
ncbi:MAG: SpoIIE family protein phosphatase [Clostridium sp.]|nr:SpoIIE family protein phosphatase [Clostridium sp.]